MFSVKYHSGPGWCFFGRGIRLSSAGVPWDCHRLGGSNDGNLWSPSSEGQKSEVKMLAGLVLSDASLLGV